VTTTTARAVGITETGGPEVLRVVERVVPGPAAGQVRIAVRAAAVNPSDVGQRQRGVEGVPPPWVPGWDAAGIVESVGAGVVDVAVGDEVMAVVLPRRPEGGAQVELLVAPAESVIQIPPGVTLEQAATLPMNGLTALRGLELLGLGEGATLLVTGGAGLLASYVIPIAKRQGLRVFADARPDDDELVRGFGADLVLPRGEGLPAAVRDAVPGGVDAVFDTALLGRSAFRAIREGGALAYVRTWDGEDEEDGIAIRRVWVGDVLDRTDWLRELSELAAAGVLALRVAAEFPPEQAADAHRLMEAGGLRGRALISFRS
jgi:NADPH:quinone reductase-like Zn-dependent oxidoreductase